MSLIEADKAIIASLIISPTISLPLNEATAVTPVDGRYAQVNHLNLDSTDSVAFRNYFSEYAWLRGQRMMEIKWLQALCKERLIKIRGVPRTLEDQEVEAMDRLWRDYTQDDFLDTKKIELSEGVKHQPKSMEYQLRRQFQGTSFEDLGRFIHIGLTSDDPTNIAINVNIQYVKDKILVPTLESLAIELATKSADWVEHPMVGRTHQRRAVPTTISKETAAFGERLARFAAALDQIHMQGKVTGAVGNFNELVFAFPEHEFGRVDWLDISKRFVASLGLEPTVYTTQSQNYDRWAELFNLLTQINTVVKSVDDNMRNYIKLDYFRLVPGVHQKGSSVMPHKGRNPELFDRSAGSVQISRMVLNGLALELPNRLDQREFDDSTLSRWVGIGIVASYLGWRWAREDLKDMVLSEEGLKSDLENSWEVITAGIQTRLKVIGVDDAYEKFDAMAKKGPITRGGLIEYIESLDIPQIEKDYLLNLTPMTYIGEAERIAEMMRAEIQ